MTRQTAMGNVQLTCSNSCVEFVPFGITCEDSVIMSHFQLSKMLLEDSTF